MRIGKSRRKRRRRITQIAPVQSVNVATRRAAAADYKQMYQPTIRGKLVAESHAGIAENSRRIATPRAGQGQGPRHDTRGGPFKVAVAAAQKNNPPMFWRLCQNLAMARSLFAALDAIPSQKRGGPFSRGALRK